MPGEELPKEANINRKGQIGKIVSKYRNITFMKKK